MERRKFEDSFKEAFQQAEVNPSENVWTNIELDLEKAEGDKMKRRLIFFKMLAAASVIFAMTVAGIGYFALRDPQRDNLAQQPGPNVPAGEQDDNKVTIDEKEKSNLPKDVEERKALADASSSSGNQSANSNSTENSRAASPQSPSSRTLSETENGINGQSGNAEERVSRDSDAVVKKRWETGNQVADIKANTVGVPDAGQAAAPSRTSSPNSDNQQNINTVSTVNDASTLVQKKVVAASKHERKLPLFYEPKQPALQFPQSTADPGMLLLAKLDAEQKQLAREDKSQKKNNTEKLWTSVGFAAGAFDSNNPSVSPVYSNSVYSLNASNAAAKQSKASGTTYSFGLSVGTRLSERWVLQGGFSYLTQTSDYTANGVIVGNNFEAPKAESLNAFNSQLADVSAQTRVAQTYPYNVNNNVRFVSLPIQAGYLVINRKFGLQVNAGVATDLFLQNTITPDGGGLSKTTQGRGDDSPYRSLNFSGLMGTELSYKLGYRYRVSLNPGVRYPFSSVYKSNTGVDATPLTFDVGLRFRYIFH